MQVDIAMSNSVPLVHMEQRVVSCQEVVQFLQMQLTCSLTQWGLQYHYFPFGHQVKSQHHLAKHMVTLDLRFLVSFLRPIDLDSDQLHCVQCGTKVDTHHIIHKNLKPTTTSYLLRVKVPESGCAKDNFQAFDRSNTFRVGTGFYRAPEIMDDKFDGAGYDTMVDVYSFAFVCYQILSGKKLIQRDPRPPRVLWRAMWKGELRPEFDFECEDALREMVEASSDQDASRRPDFAQIADFRVT